MAHLRVVVVENFLQGGDIRFTKNAGRSGEIDQRGMILWSGFPNHRLSSKRSSARRAVVFRAIPIIMKHMTSATTCPFCNAQVAVDAADRAGARIQCPRCGEAFPIEDADGPVSFRVADPSVVDTPATPTRYSNRAVAGIVLAVMLFMALLALRFALSTTEFRRSLDKTVVKPEAITVPLWLRVARNLWIAGLVFLLASLSRWPFRWWVAGLSAAVLLIATVSWPTETLRRRSSQKNEPIAPLVRVSSPAELPALAYLPEGISAVIAIQMADFLQASQGKNTLDDIVLPGTDWRLSRLAAAIGLPPENIDHAVLGMRLTGNRFPPPSFLVVHTVQPISEDWLRDHLMAEALPEPNRFRCKLANPPLEVGLLRPDDTRVLVFTYELKDLDAIPADKANDKNRLSPNLRKLIAERVGSAPHAWLCVHGLDWSQPVLVQLAKLLPQEFRGPLPNLRDLAVRVETGKKTVLLASIRCDNDKVGKWRELLDKWLNSDDRAKISVKDDWLMVQLTMSP